MSLVIRRQVREPNSRISLVIRRQVREPNSHRKVKGRRKREREKDTWTSWGSGNGK